MKLSIQNFWKSLCWVERSLLLVVLLLAIRSLAPLWMSGFPTTHDGEGHVARAANYAVALRQGHIPPRIAPTFSDGYGYPVFNFHYPLLSMTAAPLILGGIHPELAVKLVIMSAWILLWLGILFYAQLVTKSFLAALIGLAVFMVTPYMYSLVYVRGSYGELLASAACIWLFYWIEKRTFLKDKKKVVRMSIVFLSALLLLAHNIYAVLLFPVTFLYAVYRKGTLSLVQILSEFSLGFGLSAFFWIPALLEKKYIIFDEKFGSFYLEHFVEFSQLFNSQVTYGVSAPGSADTLSYGMGIAGITVFFVALIYSIAALLKKQTLGRRIPFFLLSSILFILLMLPVSLPLWKSIFILPYIQFPWRLLGPLAVVLALLGAHFWQRLSQIGRGLLLLGVAAGSGYAVFWYWPATFHNTRDYYLNYRQSTTLLDELRPKTFTVEPGNLSPQQPEVIGSGTVTIEKWRGTYRRYSVVAEEEITVVEPTMYFPGWKVEANGVALDSSEVNKNKGQVAYKLPPGEWRINSYISQDTPARIVGNGLTILSIVCIGFLYGNIFLRKKVQV